MDICLAFKRGSLRCDAQRWYINQHRPTNPAKNYVSRYRYSIVFRRNTRDLFAEVCGPIRIAAITYFRIVPSSKRFLFYETHPSTRPIVFRRLKSIYSFGSVRVRRFRKSTRAARMMCTV